ncbi:hypothetical protein PR048_028772 [Dryococelus australis]|uniref:DDE-1 domain-containing protein n=1 Tax=Dryococelus australis TaxID=614101 RepID=A0ABQ9GBH1_9NEOP|nr:hypothetical protein PR048_028772 [Dryococelus australis]
MAWKYGTMESLYEFLLADIGEEGCYQPPSILPLGGCEIPEIDFRHVRFLRSGAAARNGGPFPLARASFPWPLRPAGLAAHHSAISFRSRRMRRLCRDANVQKSTHARNHDVSVPLCSLMPLPACELVEHTMRAGLQASSTGPSHHASPPRPCCLQELTELCVQHVTLPWGAFYTSLAWKNVPERNFVPLSKNEKPRGTQTDLPVPCVDKLPPQQPVRKKRIKCVRPSLKTNPLRLLGRKIMQGDMHRGKGDWAAMACTLGPELVLTMKSMGKAAKRRKNPCDSEARPLRQNSAEFGTRVRLVVLFLYETLPPPSVCLVASAITHQQGQHAGGQRHLTVADSKATMFTFGPAIPRVFRDILSIVRGGDLRGSFYLLFIKAEVKQLPMEHCTRLHNSTCISIRFRILAEHLATQLAASRLRFPFRYKILQRQLCVTSSPIYSKRMIGSQRHECENPVTQFSPSQRREFIRIDATESSHANERRPRIRTHVSRGQHPFRRALHGLKKIRSSICIGTGNGTESVQLRHKHAIIRIWADCGASEASGRGHFFNKQKMRASKKWWSNFKEKYGLTLRVQENLSAYRASMGSAVMIDDYFDKHTNYEETQNSGQSEGSHMECLRDWSHVCSETKQSGGRNREEMYIQQDVHRTWIIKDLSTLYMCYWNLDSTLHHFQRFSHKKGCLPNTQVHLSDRGWITKELLLMWFQFFFDCTDGSPKPMLLLMDSRGAHITPHVYILTFPSLMTLMLQSLDKAIKSVWQKELNDYMAEHPTDKPNKQVFHPIFKVPFIKAISDKTKNAFRTCGIVSSDKTVIPKEKMVPSLLTERPVPEEVVPSDANQDRRLQRQLPAFSFRHIQLTIFRSSQQLIPEKSLHVDELSLTLKQNSSPRAQQQFTKLNGRKWRFIMQLLDLLESSIEGRLQKRRQMCVSSAGLQCLMTTGHVVFAMNFFQRQKKLKMGRSGCSVLSVLLPTTNCARVSPSVALFTCAIFAVKDEVNTCVLNKSMSFTDPVSGRAGWQRRTYHEPPYIQLEDDYLLPLHGPKLTGANNTRLSGALFFPANQVDGALGRDL